MENKYLELFRIMHAESIKAVILDFILCSIVSLYFNKSNASRISKPVSPFAFREALEKWVKKGN